MQVNPNISQDDLYYPKAGKYGNVYVGDCDTVEEAIHQIVEVKSNHFDMYHNFDVDVMKENLHNQLNETVDDYKMLEVIEMKTLEEMAGELL